ncbi:MAG: MmcQ/YjbR family DNA-binding protein [Cyclobacteriaceae bacterium]|nr:MmcQ/YjbR family DNA-binding protein [Cyclobacteriaceae bacterium]
MQQIDFLRQIALSLPDTTEDAHFDKTSFRVRKKIFTTYDKKNNRACLKLSEIDQYVFSTIVHDIPVNRVYTNMISQWIKEQ